MTDFFSSFVKNMKDDDLSIVSDGVSSAEFSGFLDTGCYLLNAGISGSIFGGIPNNKILAIAGAESTGKSFLMLNIIKHFLSQNPESGVFYFDTESAITKDMMAERGIDTDRVVLSEPNTIQEFRNTTLKILDQLEEQDEKPPVIMVLDSLGQLSSTKEVEDTAAGNETVDMTKAKALKATFRVIRGRLAKLGIPLLVTNHTYSVIGSYVPEEEMAGGSGLKFSADTIIFLSKKKDKDGKDIIGNIIRCKMKKSRFAKENKVIELKLSYDTGLDKYFGLHEIAEKYDYFKRVGNRYELPSGEKVFLKAITANPEKYYTKEVLEKIEEFVKREFPYGSSFRDDEEEEVE